MPGCIIPDCCIMPCCSKPDCCVAAKLDIIAFTRARSGLLFASSRSAAEPWRSPRVPFL